MTFNSAEEAMDWAMTVLKISREGRGQVYDPDRMGGGQSIDNYSDALDIENMAKRACQGARSCATYRPGCLESHLVPDPLVDRPRLSEPEYRRILGCVMLFEDELYDAGFLTFRPRYHKGVGW